MLDFTNMEWVGSCEENSLIADFVSYEGEVKVDRSMVDGSYQVSKASSVRHSVCWPPW